MVLSSAGRGWKTDDKSLFGQKDSSPLPDFSHWTKKDVWMFEHDCNGQLLSARDVFWKLVKLQVLEFTYSLPISPRHLDATIYWLEISIRKGWQIACAKSSHAVLHLAYQDVKIKI